MVEIYILLFYVCVRITQSCARETIIACYCATRCCDVECIIQTDLVCTNTQLVVFMYVYRQYNPVFIMIVDAWVIVLYIGVDVFVVCVL